MDFQKVKTVLINKSFSVSFNSSFALTSTGALFELCQYTGMATPIDCPENILDFIITTTNDEGIEILALTQDSTATKSLKVFDYPSK